MLRYFLIAFLSFSGILSHSQNLTDSLLIHYKFDGNLADSSGNVYDGTAFGTSFTADRFGNPNSACYFNGVSDYINFPNLTALKPDLPVSFSMWIKYDSEQLSDRAVLNTSYEEDLNAGVSITSSSVTGGYAANFAAGGTVFSSSNRRTFVSDVAIDTSQWHFIAVIINGPTDFEIYVDCERVGGTHSGTGGNLVYSTQAGCIGRHDQGNNTQAPSYFKGKIDDFRYFNRALTANDINFLCQESAAFDEVNIEKNEVIIFPNPNNGSFDISLTSNELSITEIQLLDIRGREVAKMPFSNHLDLQHFENGMYMIQFLNHKLEVVDRQKLIIE